MDNSAVVPSALQPANLAAGGVFAQMSPRTRGMLLLGAAGLAAVVAAAWLFQRLRRGRGG